MNAINNPTSRAFITADPYYVRVPYRTAAPFAHVVIDDALPADQLAAVCRAVDETPPTAFARDDIRHQTKKLWVSDYNAMPDALRRLTLWFNSGEVLHWMSDLTGIPNLLPDMTYYGGGLHVTRAGGHLGIHTDFNVHPYTRLYRRVNALLFLNPDWQEAWGGHLNLYPPNVATAAVSVLPVLGRLVVFDITDKSWHGMPEKLKSPARVERRSLALYYYTVDPVPGQEGDQPHMARWLVPDAAGGYAAGRFVQ